MPTLCKHLAATLVALALAAGPALSAESAHHRIGIVGSGQVGSTLGALWAKAGDEVMFSSRHPDELKDIVAKAGPNASAGTPAQAVAFGDVVVMAVPYKAMPEVTAANADALKGKVVFDATNAIPARDGAIVDDVRKVGIGAYSAKLMPGSHLVRGFNAINYKNMAADGFRKGDPVGIPLAADDKEAAAVGSDLVTQIGFEPVVVPLTRADEFGPGRPLGAGVFSVAEWKRKLGLAQ